jgi:hypothetical protein
MTRLLLVTALVIGLLGHYSLASVPTTTAQCTYSEGTPVQLVGTPHLFIADAQGVLHWGGDTRALAGKEILWGNQCTVTLSELTAATRGDPWLSAGLPKIGDPIYLAKWEDTDRAPRFLRIQSIPDVELFGINTANYGNFIMERGPWEQRFGFSVATLRVGPLASAASFSWSETDRAAYAQLLSDMEIADSEALARAQSTGTGVEVALPRIAICEKQGLDIFDANRNASAALQATRTCLGSSGPPPPTPAPVGAGTPGNVRVIQQSSTSLLISWDGVPGATGYRIYGGPQGTTSTETLATTTGPAVTSTTIQGLTPGATYCYSVSAVTAAGESPRSAPPACTTAVGPNAPPSTPSNLRVQSATADTVTLIWTNTAMDQEGFYLYEGSNTVATVPPSLTMWTITGWNGSLQHCYEITAYNARGQSGRSNSVCAGPIPTATPLPGATPGAPTLTPTPAGPTPTRVPSNESF